MIYAPFMLKFLLEDCVSAFSKIEFGYRVYLWYTYSEKWVGPAIKKIEKRTRKSSEYFV